MVNTKKIALGGFMNIEEAFTVSAKAVEQQEVNSLVVRWIVAMLNGRKVEATVCDSAQRYFIACTIFPILDSYSVKECVSNLNNL